MAPRPRQRAAAPSPRPRPRKEPAANGTHAIEPDDPVRTLTHAIEDLHAAAKLLHLPPIRVEWQETDPDLSELPDEDRKRLQEHISSLVADYEGLRLGPVSWPLDQIPPPADPDDWLVEGLIRPGTTVMIAGRYGAAKSWASRQLALACGAGAGLFLDRYPIARPMNVLVIDEDNGPNEEWRREESLLEHLSLRRSDVASVRRTSLEGVLLDKEPWQRWLRGQIRLHELDLVVLDPISEFHGGKELREDPEFRSLLAFLKRLKVDFPRTATVLVHHTRKPSTSDRSTERSLDDVRGQWGQTPDVIAIVSPMADRRSMWEVHKRAPHSRLTIEQTEKGKPGEGGLHTVADETTGISRSQQTDGKVLSAIDAGARTAEEIRLGTGLSRQGVFKALARLHGAGLVSKRAPYERLQDNDDPIEEDPQSR